MINCFGSRTKNLTNQTLLKILAHQSHQNHSSSRASTDSQQQSQVSAAEIMSAAGLAAMAAAELGNNLRYCNNARTKTKKDLSYEFDNQILSNFDIQDFTDIIHTQPTTILVIIHTFQVMFILIIPIIILSMHITLLRIILITCIQAFIIVFVIKQIYVAIFLPIYY